jgi:single-strand DNA-binding protein
MHVIHGEMRKAPFVKSGCGQDQQSTMFIIELAEVNKDSRTGEKDYTNYSAAIFAKSPAQINHYNTTLVEGNFVVVTGDKLKVDVSESQGKQYIKLQVENARLEGSGYIDNNQQQQQQQAPQQQGGFQGQQQQPQYQQPQQQQSAFQQQQQQPSYNQNGWDKNQNNQ